MSPEARRARYEQRKARERLADPLGRYAGLPRSGPDVSSHRGHAEPTTKQLALLANLAEQAGTRTPGVTTRGGASRAIDRLRERQHRGKHGRAAP